MNLMAKLKRFLRVRCIRIVKRLRCDHSHTFTAHVQNAHWFSYGEKQGQHKEIEICGCYKCGKVWCRDFAA